MRSAYGEGPRIAMTSEVMPAALGPIGVHAGVGGASEHASEGAAWEAKKTAPAASAFLDLPGHRPSAAGGRSYVPL